jgi:hypothetical protein
MRTSFFPPLYAPWTRDEAREQRGQIYRLRHWPELPGPMHTADVLGALSVMSSRPVNRDWILRHCKLKPAALDELLRLLVARGDLEVVDTSNYPAAAR